MFRVDKELLVVLLLSLLLPRCSQAIPELVLPEERTTGLGCIPEGRNVSYECTVTDPSDLGVGSTTWHGSAFSQCSSNEIKLLHSEFTDGTQEQCGNLTARPLYVNGTSYVSRLELTASADLKDRVVSCSLSDEPEVASDTLTIGAIPPPPGPLTVNLTSGSSPILSWSPPSEPVEGGMGGYMYVLGVTGEGCGCVTMNVSAATTSVTCSGWTATGQTCSFEVRTVSQDCRLTSESVEASLIACDPAQLGDSPTSTVNSGEVTTPNGVIYFNGVTVSSTAFLSCNGGFQSSATSTNRTCLSNGNWSEGEQVCVSSSTEMLAALAALCLLPVLVVCILFTISCLTGWCGDSRLLRERGNSCVLCVFTFGGLYAGVKLRECCHPVRRKNKGEYELPDYGSSDIQLIFTDMGRSTPPDNISQPIRPVAYKNFAYFRHFNTRQIYIYNSSTKKWAKVSILCPFQDTALVILPLATSYALHTVGGYDKEGNCIVGDLYYLDESPMANNPWNKSRLPSMREKRMGVIAVCDTECRHLIVAGGRNENGPSTIVEVLPLDNLDNMVQEWRKVASLPQRVFQASGCVCGDTLYVLGGNIFEKGDQREISSAYRASLSELTASRPGRNKVFHKIPDVPHLRSACVTFSDRLFAIGGTSYHPDTYEPELTDHMYVYHPESGKWKRLMASLHTKRCNCFAISLTEPTPQLMVVGGYTIKHDKGCTNSAELFEMQS